MTLIDIIIIIIFLGLVIHGLIIGFIRGVFEIAGILLGYFLAVNYSATVKIPKVLAFILIFLGVVIVISIIGRIVSKIIHFTPLGMFDRILGAIFGFLKALIICFVFLIVVSLFRGDNRMIYKSQFAPWIVRAGISASRVLPRSWYEWIKKTLAHKELVDNVRDYNFSI